MYLLRYHNNINKSDTLTVVITSALHPAPLSMIQPQFILSTALAMNVKQSKKLVISTVVHAHGISLTTLAYVSCRRSRVCTIT